MNKYDILRELDRKKVLFCSVHRFAIDSYRQGVNDAIRLVEQLDEQRTEITLESAIDYLHSIGWMQKHDKEMTEYAEKQRTGHWIETADEYYKAVNEYGGGVNEDTPYFTDNIGCSVCLAMFSTIDNETERFKYCPNCGAKMESEEI